MKIQKAILAGLAGLCSILFGIKISQGKANEIPQASNIDNPDPVPPSVKETPKLDHLKYALETDYNRARSWHGVGHDDNINNLDIQKNE